MGNGHYARVCVLACVVACEPTACGPTDVADRARARREQPAAPAASAVVNQRPAERHDVPVVRMRAPVRPLALALTPSAVPQRQWEPPALDLERGSCWVRLRRLPSEAIQATRLEFLRRNPGWEINPIHIDPFTGLVVQANAFRRSDLIGAPVELPEREYARRRLEPLQDNADLIGISERELAALRWSPEPFVGSESTFMGSTARATALRSDPALQPLGALRGGWSVTVRFARDGEVSGFSAERSGPPVSICASARINAARARAARGLTDAAAQPQSLGSFTRGFTVERNEIGDARLALDMYLDGGPSTRAASATWRLVWAVDVQAAHFTFLVDAVSGEVTGLRKNFVQ